MLTVAVVVTVASENVNISLQTWRHNQKQYVPLCVGSSKAPPVP